MKNTIGNALTVTLFGESHGEAIGAVVDGIAPGIPVDLTYIERQLARRRPKATLDTARCEPDPYRIVSGVFNGKTTGTPLCIIISNTDTRSTDYTYGVARPSHADYTASIKYHGFEDYRGGGHFSGRITAALVAVGGILIPALQTLGIYIGTHILHCAGISDQAFSNTPVKEIQALDGCDFPVLNHESQNAMIDKIRQIKAEGDSIGGITETAIEGMPAGVGEPWFDSVESLLSHALFSIGGIKGVEFGLGFDFDGKRGSECNDSFVFQNQFVRTLTNYNGGINGGITNGMPILFRCAIKPTPSIAKEQHTINFVKGTSEALTIHGRHDPAIIRRICPVIDSICAITLCDLIVQRYGTDGLLKGAASWNMD